MSIHITIDKAGRVVIPKPLREELHLEPGDTLELESAGERITLHPVRGTGPPQKEHNVWVFRADVPLSSDVTDGLLKTIRKERDEKNLEQTQ